MSGPIVIGLDSRPASRDALELAGTLSEQAGAGLIAVHVPQSEHLFTPYDQPYQRDLRAYLRELRSDLAPVLERVPAGRRHEVRAYHAITAAAGLHELASAERARMIVVGSSHRTPAGRVLVGSTAARLLLDACCPVAVAPRGLAEAGRPLETVGVALDGCRCSAAAFERAGVLAAELDARLVAVSVATRHGVAPSPAGIEQVVLEGPPVRALTRASERLDLLVVGCRETGGVAGHPTLRSVSRRLMQTSACPLLVVPESLRLEGQAGGRYAAGAPA